MNARVGFIVGLKVLGIYLLAKAIVGISGAVPITPLPVVRTSALPLAIALTQTVVQAVIAVALIVQAARIADRLKLAGESEGELVRAGVSLIGISMLALSVVTLAALVFLPFVAWRVYLHPIMGLVVGAALLFVVPRNRA